MTVWLYILGVSWAVLLVMLAVDEFNKIIKKK